MLEQIKNKITDLLVDHEQEKDLEKWDIPPEWFANENDKQ